MSNVRGTSGISRRIGLDPAREELIEVYVYTYFARNEYAKKPAKQGFAAFGFTKIDAKAHQQVIERQVAEGAGKRHLLEPANSAGVRAAVAPPKAAVGQPKGRARGRDGKAQEEGTRSARRVRGGERTDAGKRARGSAKRREAQRQRQGRTAAKGRSCPRSPCTQKAR